MTYTISRRRLLAGAAGLGSAALLAACGKDSESKNTGNDTGAVTLNVWGGVPPESGPDALFAAFTAKHPNIKVKYTRYVNDDQGNLKLDTALQGGLEIDVVVSYARSALAKRVEAGLLTDLTDRIAGDATLKAFAPGAEPASNNFFDGKAYSVPASRSVETVLANKSLLDKAGITVPEDWTAADFRAIAKELSGKDVYGCLTPPDLARQKLGPDFTYKAGGRESNFDDPAFRENFQLRLDMMAEKSAVPMTEIVAQKWDAFAQTPFLTGRVGMWISQPFVLRYIKDTKEYPHDFQTILLPLPAPQKGVPFWNTGGYGDNVAITKKSAHQDAAFTLLQFWLGEGATRMVPGGRLPSLPGGDTAVLAADLGGPDAAKLFDERSLVTNLLTSDARIPVDTIQTAHAEIATIMNGLNQRVLLGSISLDEWARTAKQQCDAAIKKVG
ncbi:extracellular solute-binding protein [Sphaerisporangium sp. NPDC005289]|uniref:ABC transporter substrate-binding protein n=1 Tax=Sphaerisporangium sp. NPDC005289 TaxID=3155247 RepID=UPI0033AD0685